MATLVERIDAFQQRHPTLGFPWAVLKRFNEDEGNRLAALMTYYGFLSLLPILILALGIASKVLAKYPNVQQDLISQLPVDFQDTAQEGLQNLLAERSIVPFVIGIVGVLLTSLGVMSAAMNTLNKVWAIPFRQRPNIVHRYLRGLVMLLLVVLGSLVVAVMGTQNLVPLPIVGAVASHAATFLVLFGILYIGPQVSVPGKQPIRSVCIGAGYAALIITVLVALGSSIIARAATRAGPVYGPLASVVGFFAILLLVNRVLVIAAEVSVVHAYRLWPRSLGDYANTEADTAALELTAKRTERVTGQVNTVSFEPDDLEPTGTRPEPDE